MSALLELLQDSAAAVRGARARGVAPEVALVLGSGLAGAVRLLEDAESLPLADVPHVAHAERVRTSRAGSSSAGSAPCASACSRAGCTPTRAGRAAETAYPVRLLVTLGARVVVLTNASGGVREGLAAGDWMAITDHLNLSGKNPLEGPNDPRLGPALPGPLARLRPGPARAAPAARRTASGVPLQEGVYAMMAGPLVRDAGGDPDAPARSARTRWG